MEFILDGLLLVFLEPLKLGKEVIVLQGLDTLLEVLELVQTSNFFREVGALKLELVDLILLVANFIFEL